MSGSTIGGVVGGIVGFVVSGFNPAGFQYGFLAGPAVGGRIDPSMLTLEADHREEGLSHDEPA